MKIRSSLHSMMYVAAMVWASTLSPSRSMAEGPLPAIELSVPPVASKTVQEAIDAGSTRRMQISVSTDDVQEELVRRRFYVNGEQVQSTEFPSIGSRFLPGNVTMQSILLGDIQVGVPQFKEGAMYVEHLEAVGKLRSSGLSVRARKTFFYRVQKGRIVQISRREYSASVATAEVKLVDRDGEPRVAREAAVVQGEAVLPTATIPDSARAERID
jgi:hypothetical protein